MDFSFKKISGKIFEAVLVLLLVMFIFLGILYTLNTVFPTGFKLRNLVSRGTPDSSYYNHNLAARELRLNTSDGEYGLGETAGITAVLSDMDNLVKTKRHDQVAWKGAAEGMTFYNKDAIQTFRKSSATVLFKEGNFLKLNENSLIVLRNLEKDPFTRDNRMTVVLMSGQLSGQISKIHQENYNLEVLAPGAIARAPSKNSKDAPARFRMSVGPDETSILTVLDGTVDLEVGGKTVEVVTDQIVKVQPGKQLVYLRPPPSPPALVTPANDNIFYFRDIPPKVSFTWKPGEGIKDYHLIVSKDPQFQEVVYEGRVESGSFSHGNLKQGDYYWRVSSVNSDGEGVFSQPRHFVLIQDLERPTLIVNYPDTPEPGDRFELSGRTDPDARIFVGGMPVKVDENGEFVHDLFLKRGYNVIVVEAVDSVGNVNYFSRTVNVEF
jgi:hypothetical protein